MIVRRRGAVGELHALDPFPERTDVASPMCPQLWWYEPQDTAIVLGSRQSPDLLDVDLCARRGITVAHRRSGGGAVLISPDDVIWVDIVMPNDQVPDDVRRSMVWAGESWREALAAQLPAGATLEVHSGAATTTPSSDLVCFAGIGPGEVLLDGRKLVGLSQRRTRRGVRIQGMLYLRPPAIDIGELFRPPVPSVELPEIAFLDGIDATVLTARLATALEQR